MPPAHVLGRRRARRLSCAGCAPGRAPGWARIGRWPPAAHARPSSPPSARRPRRCRRTRRRTPGGESGHDPPVVHQGEALVVVPENPVGGHGVHGQLAPGPEPGRAEPVLVEDGQVEEVRRRSGVLGLEVRQRDPLDEDPRSVDVQLRRPAADAGAVRRGRGHEVGDPAVAQQSTAGWRRPGGWPDARRTVDACAVSPGGRAEVGVVRVLAMRLHPPCVGSFVRVYAGSLTAGPAAARSRVMRRRRVGRPSIGLATPQAAPLQTSSL